MDKRVLNDFILQHNVIDKLIGKYTNVIPDELMEVWMEYGFGSFLNGYLKTINPDEYIDLVHETYVLDRNSIPIFTTGMSDVIVLENGEHVRLLNYRRGLVKRICMGMEFFFEDLENDFFLEKCLDWEPYMRANRVLGVPAYDECYGYIPLLGLGGAEKYENLQKVKIKEHIYMITQLTGPINNVERV